MENTKQIMEKLERYINEVEAVREKVIEGVREIISNCRRGTQLIHRGLKDDAEKAIEEGYKKLMDLYDLTSRYAEMFRYNLVESAAREVVEAKCLLSFVKKERLPDPEEIGVSPSSFLLGLCDAVGELRRLSIDALRRDRIEEANYYLGIMEEIYDSVMRFSNPSSILPIKKRQDRLRSIIEKTRSEIAIASCERRIREKVEEFRELVMGKEKKEEKNMDLDIDKVW